MRLTFRLQGLRGVFAWPALSFSLNLLFYVSCITCGPPFPLCSEVRNGGGPKQESTRSCCVFWERFRSSTLACRFSSCSTTCFCCNCGFRRISLVELARL